MLFRKCGGQTLFLAERYICSNSPTNRSYLSTLILNSSNGNYHFGLEPNPSFCILKSRNSNIYRTMGVRTKSWMTPVRLRRTKSLGISGKSGGDWVQKAGFITIPGTGAKRKDYSERRIMGFSREQMYDVVADVDKYQEFLPWCKSSLVKTRRKGHIIADLVVGFPPLVESYTSSVTMTKPHLIRAESTQGKLFNQLITTWKFSPGLKGKPQTCVVDFYVSFEFRSALTSQLANVFFNEVVRAMAGAFYDEAKVRYGAESIPSRKINIVPVGADGRDKD